MCVLAKEMANDATVVLYQQIIVNEKQTAADNGLKEEANRWRGGLEQDNATDGLANNNERKKGEGKEG